MIQNTIAQLMAVGPSATPTAPPGADKITSILGWGLWIATGACIAAILFAGIKMAMGGEHGRGTAGMGLVFALAGTVVCGASAAAVTLLF